MLAALPHQPGRVHVEVAAPFIAGGAGQRHQQQQRVHLRRVPPLGQQPQRVDRAVDPQVVAVDDVERVAVDQRQRLGHPAAGFEQQLALVGQFEVEPGRLAAQVGNDLVGEIMRVDHGAADACGAQMIERAVEQGPPADLDQRLGPGRGQRPHPLAQPRRQHHRGGRHRHVEHRAQRQRGREPAAHPAISASPRALAGTLASNQSRTGASTG